jgi:hypothetical protein
MRSAISAALLATTLGACRGLYCGVEDVTLTIVNSLLETGNFADATIICVKKEWKVHKTILCPRSKWFADAFDDKNQACCSRSWGPFTGTYGTFLFH